MTYRPSASDINMWIPNAILGKVEALLKKNYWLMIKYLFICMYSLKNIHIY